jgi:YD repeat-containing protein
VDLLANSGYDPDGNLVNYTDTVMGTWAFSYDTLNRLSGGATNQSGNPNPYHCWNYDIYGNRWQQEESNAAFQSGSGGPNSCQPQTSATVATQLTSFGGNNNQITSMNVRGVTRDPVRSGSFHFAGDRVCFDRAAAWRSLLHSIEEEGIYLRL